MAENNIEALTIAVANKVTVAGGAAAAVSGVAVKTEAILVSVTDFCALCGAGCAVAGLLVGTFFQWRRDRRATKEFQSRFSGE